MIQDYPPSSTVTYHARPFTVIQQTSKKFVLRCRFSSAWTVFSRSSDMTKTPELIHDEVNPVKTELDPHLWLACRLKMVHCLSCEENSLGRIAGFSRSVVALTGSCEQHCEQAIDEADAFGDTEILAEFRVTAILLKLQHGSLTQADVEELKV